MANVTQNANNNNQNETNAHTDNKPSVLNDLGVRLIISSGPGTASNPSNAGVQQRGMMSGPGSRGMMSGPGNRGLMSGPGIPMGRGGLVSVPPPPGVQVPSCVACSNPIYGEYTEAGGRHYHPEHFVCDYCAQPLAGRKFLVGADQKLYCETDYYDLFSSRCAYCKDVIRGKSMTAGAQSYHSEHFLCCSCGTNLVGKSHKVDNTTKLLYCCDCKEKEVGKGRPEGHMCAECKTLIVGPYLLIKGKFVHPRHYRCQECGKEFKGGDCHEFEGDYYCTPHYEILLLKKCARCGKPCKGRSVTALGKVWHPDCFTCHTCHTLFTESSYYENNGHPYCKAHYNELFGDSCHVCSHPITDGTGIKFLDKAYHAQHFNCTHCFKPLVNAPFAAWDGKPLCMYCYSVLPKKVREESERRLKEEKKAKIEREKNTQQ